MDKCLIMTTGRTGSDYLHACLDDINGVMTLCGKFDYHQFFNGPSDKIDKEKLIDLFLKKYHYLFSYNEIEDIDTNVDIKSLKENFLRITPALSINRKDFLLNLFKSYHITLNRKIENVKVLVHHTHGIEETSKFLMDFPDSKMLITIRDPRANLKSGLVNWFDYDQEKIHMSHIFVYLKRIREDLKFALKKNNNKKLFVKLEEANDKETKRKINDFLGINYDEKIMTATLASKIWAGDRLSKTKSKDGAFNESVKDNQWEKFFTYKEKLLLNQLYKDYKRFDYNIVNLNWKEKLQIFTLVFFPMSFEKLAFKSRGNDFFRKISNYKYFFKRIIYLLLVIFKCDMFIKHKTM